LKFLWSLGLGIWSFAPVTLADTPAAFRDAAALYDAGQFEQAAARYESLAAAGVRSANLFFNLGNAWFKAGQMGRAILNYERARHIAPRDPDIRGNLDFVVKESRARDTVATTGLTVWLAGLRDYLTVGEWTTLTALGYWLAMATAIAFVWLPASVEWRRWLRVVIAACAALAALGGIGFAAKTTVENGPPPAIVTARKEVVVRFAPVDDAQRHYTAVEGQKLWVIGERESRMEGVPGWFKVERADGAEGWVPANTVEKI
jgi:tetratricopeptide (TPR) repeat protein